MVLILSTFAYAGTSSLTLENDAIVGKDNHYTNGLYYTWMSDNNTTFPDVLPFLGMKQKNVAFSVSHAVFTPKDKKMSTRDLNDLPYAGYLNFNFLFYKSSSNFFNEIGVNTGLVGPSTGADSLQKNFHSLIGHTKPKGWDNQLKDHFVGGISYQLGYKTTPMKIKSLNLDFTTNIKADYGNFYQGGLVGGTARLSRFPLTNFSLAGAFIDANEGLILNYKTIKEFNWAFSLGVYYNKFYKYYLIDKAIDEGYNLQSIDYIQGAKFAFDLYYDDYAVSFYLKSVTIYQDGPSNSHNEKTGGISVVFKF
jgi:hypothetical protein